MQCVYVTTVRDACRLYVTASFIVHYCTLARRYEPGVVVTGKAEVAPHALIQIPRWHVVTDPRLIGIGRQLRSAFVASRVEHR